MNYFDLHCDTLTEIYKRKLTLENNNLHVKNSLAKFDKYTATFAVFTPEILTGENAINYFLSVINYAKDFGGLNKFENENRKAIISTENGNVLAGKINNISILKENGVKIFGLTWNGQNELGGGADCFNVPLTDFGGEVITECEAQKIVVDVSHLGEKSFYDLCKLAKKPFIASHSNCKSVVNIGRNLSDDQLKIIFSVGGLVGINFYPPFNQIKIFESIFNNINHMISLGGAKNISIGSDFDGSYGGAEMNKKLNSIDKVNDLYYYLFKHKLDKNILDDIFYNNAVNFFKNYDNL